MQRTKHKRSPGVASGAASLCDEPSVATTEVHPNTALERKSGEAMKHTSTAQDLGKQLPEKPESRSSRKKRRNRFVL